MNLLHAHTLAYLVLSALKYVLYINYYIFISLILTDPPFNKEFYKKCYKFFRSLVFINLLVEKGLRRVIQKELNSPTPPKKYNYHFDSAFYPI